LRRDRVRETLRSAAPAQHLLRDQLRAGGVDPPVHGLVEVLGPEELADPVERLVVDEDGPEHRLLGLDVMGLDPELRGVGERARAPAIDHG
jgi:hypothetical protein